MPGASTILIAREDLSIPGGEFDQSHERRRPAQIEAQFFTLLRDKRPDVVVLDFRDATPNGTATIRRIRERSDVPIVVLRNGSDAYEQEYRMAGAAECLPMPVDILLLNAVVQKIMRVTGPATTRTGLQSDLFEVAGMIFQPRQNSLSVDGARIRLTTAENRLLLHLLSRPLIVCRRSEIAEILYDQHRPTTDRAIDVIVTRLRKKLASLRGPSADNLIKTEFRTGYMFVGNVSRISPLNGSGPQPS